MAIIMNDKICSACDHKDICYMYKDIQDGKKWYSEYFGDDVICPYLRNILTIKTNCFDVVERYDDCTVEVLKNTITGEQSIGWYRNDNPPLCIGCE